MNQYSTVFKENMFMKDRWEGKRVIVIGAARQGTALTRYLVRQGAHVIVNDARPFEQLENSRKSLADLDIEEKLRIKWVCGSHPLDILTGIDLICVSGGVTLTLPILMEAQLRDIPLTNDSQIFLEEAPCRVIGITGSSGKTTTTSLVGKIGRSAMNDQSRHRAGRRNIGTPLINNLEKMQESDLAVMELSSFQLKL
jgi:UDP-N-acetylmuramoylalanine--D-glutamate ligase